MPEAVAVALVSALVALPGGWAAARASNRSSRADLLRATEAIVAAQMERLTEELERLGDEVGRLRRDLDAERRDKRRLVGIVRELLTALHRYEPETVDAIRKEHPDLD